MWTSEIKFISLAQNIQNIQIISDKRILTYIEVINGWREDKHFRLFFRNILSQAPFSAYFWETPVLTKLTAYQKFEFVLVKSLALTKIKANPSNFQQYFDSAQKTEKIVTFSNLNNDALLVVPCPITQISAYAHLATFVRKAPESQQHLLLQTLGELLVKNLGEKPIRVSTSGLGVHWLHVRLDSFPKYYNYRKYV